MDDKKKRKPKVMGSNFSIKDSYKQAPMVKKKAPPKPKKGAAR